MALKIPASLFNGGSSSTDSTLADKVTNIEMIINGYDGTAGVLSDIDDLQTRVEALETAATPEEQPAG